LLLRRAEEKFNAFFQDFKAGRDEGDKIEIQFVLSVTWAKGADRSMPHW
jgi:hypothetical protein